jgi:hypothetical protein
VAGIEIQENLCKLTMLKVHPISDAKITVSAGETGGGNTGSGGGPGYPG